MKLQLPWALLSLAAVAVAERDLYPDEYCVSACMAPLYYLSFPDEFMFCVSPQERDSILLCAQNYCTAREIDAGLAITNASCEEDYGGPWPTLDDVTSILNSYTEQQYNSFQVIDWPLPETTINGTFRLSQNLFDIAYTTVEQSNASRFVHLYYSYAQFIFWGIVVGLGVAVNAVNYLRALSWDYTTHAPESRGPLTHASLPRRAWTLVRAHVLLPALGRKRAAEPVFWRQGTLAPRAESLVIISMLIINIVLCSVSYVASVDNVYYASVPLQTWRYFADRTGYLSYANLAIFWLFAIRNNILLWATGWNFNTFNRFHRWIARVSTLQAVLHSIGYTAYSFLEGKAYYDADWAEQYWYTGAIATIAMSLIIGFSVRALRVHWYEVFLLLHIALSLVVLVNLFYHTKIFEGQYDGFLYPCVAFWAFDRALRLGRLVYAILRAPVLTSAVEHDSAADVVRIDATRALAPRTPSHGGYWFVYAPASLRFWESHPFTLVRWLGTLPATKASTSSTSVAEKGAGTSVAATEEPDADVHYSFILRPRKGFTRRLAYAAETTRPIPLLFEGPYGHAPSLRGFGDVLLLIGGSGISVGIGAVYDVLTRSPSTRVHLVWASRTAALIDSVMDRELHAATTSPNLTVDAYVTGAQKPMEAGGYDSVTSRRPYVRDTVRDAVDRRRGALAVVVCGPEGMMDDARAAVCEVLREGGNVGGDVQLFLESFEW